ncbi:MAG TPA: hypothetical protein VGM82_10510 [Gemmatimonadaceae bacterium]|jgi:hypothetical protein
MTRYDELYDELREARGLYRLTRIDGQALPLRLPYRHAHCAVVEGELRLGNCDRFNGDGTVSISLNGTMSGRSHVEQIFLEREAFDQLNRRYLAFPGGSRRYGRVVRPHAVAWMSEDEIVVTMLRAQSSRYGLASIFGEHEWRFVRVADTLRTTG